MLRNRRGDENRNNGDSRIIIDIQGKLISAK